MLTSVSEKLKQAKDFTDAYKQGGDIADRELRCLRTMYPAIFKTIGENDLFVGFRGDCLARYWYAAGGGVGYRTSDRLEEYAKDETLPLEERELAGSLHEFWKVNNTRAKIWAEYPEIMERNETLFTEIYTRTAEVNLDFDRLTQMGIPGLRAKLIEMDKENPKAILKAEMGALDLIADCLLHFANEARSLIPNATPERKKELQRMADTLEYLTDHAPNTFYGALLLVCLVSRMSLAENMSRMDVYIGDFLVNDLQNGTITRDEALDIFENFYRIYTRPEAPEETRIIIGGAGRRNPENADQMAILILEVAKRVHTEHVMLSLRLHKGTNPEVWEKACDALEDGCSFPILYNDEVNIPGRMTALNITREEAEQYVMSNCGEYGLWARSIHSPNAAISYAKIFEITLYNGYDPVAKVQRGPKTGEAESFQTFEDLMDAYTKQITFFIERTADCLPMIYKGIMKESHNLIWSMLFNDSFEKGLGLFEGARYLFYDIETHSIVHIADSMLAIKKLVFEEKSMTMGEMLEALQANFEGYEMQHAKMCRVPKFGNNNKEADAMVRRVSDLIYATTSKQAQRLGVHAFTASQITVDGYLSFGRTIGATPDGRFAAQPTSNSINPMNGRDREGITSMLTSMAGVDTSLSGGQVHHLKMAPEAFSKSKRAATSAMLSAFFAAGGGELSIYTVRQEDLIDALDHPENHQDLIVRIGGYSAKFVTLSRDLQEEMVARTGYKM